VARPAALLGVGRPYRRGGIHRIRLEQGQGHNRPADRPRVRDRNHNTREQGELFPVLRYHPVFTSSPFTLIQAEEQHRDHAEIEQVFADQISGPLAHLPSGKFTANAAWLTLAGIAHNLLRAAGCLASPRLARGRRATIRADLINIAARLARHGRGHLTLHLPLSWHRDHEWLTLFQACCGPPPARAA
jgi:Transposase DDE domain group 1